MHSPPIPSVIFGGKNNFGFKGIEDDSGLPFDAKLVNLRPYTYVLQILIHLFTDYFQRWKKQNSMCLNSKKIWL